ncbi:zinc ABC transporter substrate-binding protein [Marinobacter sp.]|uniref:zinc ABC transporter substrate-binding protein n=1 Tax=Marinobacter sp. TaxID=50741 RepID=UPI002B463B6A|nr:zinc ABC transporter substrate-binding protein [Marinobacter sp.]HKK55510.1 zinc ABC transporter substrate-binding protein [Marinobacter sp.]
MHRTRSSRFAFRAAVLALALLPVSLLAAPRVVVSLKPLELLVRAVATEDTIVTTLIEPGGNPHNYSLKPSQRRALGEADAIFWIGPEMETFLTRLLNGEDFRSRSHAMMTIEDSGKHDSDDRKNDEAHGHHHDHDHGHSHDGDATGADPHIWLDPAIAGDIARRIHAVLAAQPQAEKAALDRNLAGFEQSLSAAEAEIKKQLEPTRAISLFTYHNAFTHFAEHYDLAVAGVLSLNPELAPGARHIAEVQDTLRNAQRPCLMTEEPFDEQSWDSIVGNTKVTFSRWDPLASDIEASADGYVAFQKSLAQSVLDCL